MRGPVEVFFSMTKEYIGIYIAVDQKKDDQKNARESHGNFLTDRRGE
jgi:hypothetical protein